MSLDDVSLRELRIALDYDQCGVDKFEYPNRRASLEFRRRKPRAMSKSLEENKSNEERLRWTLFGEIVVRVPGW